MTTDRTEVSVPTVDTVDIVAVGWDAPDAVRLRSAMVAEMDERYADAERPEGHEDVPTAPEVDPQSVVVMLVAYVGEEPVGCVAVRDVSGTDDRRGRGTVHPAATGEVKRLYVLPAARGRGVSRALMAEAERYVRSVGFRYLVLETGVMQPEAMALYPAMGYEPFEKFGDHVWSELQRCFFKRL